MDTLETLGLSPIEFLVLPWVLALKMMLLICMYADLMGVLSRVMVGVGMLNLGAVEYMKPDITLIDFNAGEAAENNRKSPFSRNDRKSA